MSLSELEQVMQEARSSPSRRKKKQIYNFIEQTVLSPKSSLIKNFVPPLDLVVVTISDILRSPAKLRENFPDLLDLWATVEFWRNNTLNQVKTALVWHRYYKQENPAVCLSDAEEKTLSSLDNENAKMRRIYLRFLQTSIKLDLYWLWTGEKSEVAEFVLRLNEYFPKLNRRTANQEKERAGPRVFHQDLTPEESEELYVLGQTCCQFTNDAVNWAKATRQTNLKAAFQTPEFRTAFPPPCTEETLAEAMLAFVGSVSKATVSLQRIIGPMKDDL